MISQQVGRGWNIKCFDKIKLSHIPTTYRIHANNFSYKSGSYNTVVSCQKMRDQSDWFVVVRPEEASMSYHFRYGDEMLLSSVQAKKRLHLSQDAESPVSKNMEVSLCDDDERYCAEDVWTVQKAEASQDDYWRVGQVIRIKSRDAEAFLCSHRRKIQQNDDYEVYAQKIRLSPNNNSPQKPSEGSTAAQSALKHEQSLWMVSEITPFIYTASISEQKKAKLTEQAEELGKLKATLQAIPRKEVKRMDETEQILRMENRRLEQIQEQRRKMEEQERKVSCWRKYFCCCCPAENDGYSKIK